MKAEGRRIPDIARKTREELTGMGYTPAHALDAPDNVLRHMLLQGLRPEGEYAGLDAGSCIFTGCVFTDCLLERASFCDTHFISCDFSGAALSGASFIRCTFTGCKAVGARLIDAYFHQVMLEGCHFALSNWDGATLREVTLSGCKLEGASLAGCKLKAFAPQESDLTEASFFRTPLSGVDLRTACIDRLTLQGAELSGAIVTEAQAAQLARFLGVIIR